MARRRAVLGRTRITGLVLAMAASLAACGGAAEGPGGGAPDVIRVLDYYHNEPERSVWARTLDACGEEAGVRIEREVVPGDTLIPRVLQQASSRTLPDVLMLDNPDLQQIAATGVLAPIGDFGLSADGYADGIARASTFEGQIYGLQPVTNSIGLFYNADMLAEAGIAPPTTWDELKAAAAALTQGERYGIAFSAAATYEGTWQFLPFMWSNGGDEANIATRQVADALQAWVDLVSSGSASRSVVNWTQADVGDQFKAGNAAMMINGPWQFPALDQVPGLRYEVVPIPTPQPGTTAVVPLGGETWTIPHSGDRERQAKAAQITSCLNSDENQLALATELSMVPTKSGLLDRFVVQAPKMAAFTQQIQTARSRTALLGPNWPAAATRIYTAVQTALTGGASPQQALQHAQDG
jgi:multiple sugar transport system substrate-binding protein